MCSFLESTGMEWNRSAPETRSCVRFERGMEWGGSSKQNIRLIFGMDPSGRFGRTEWNGLANLSLSLANLSSLPSTSPLSPRDWPEMRRPASPRRAAAGQLEARRRPASRGARRPASPRPGGGQPARGARRPGATRTAPPMEKRTAASRSAPTSFWPGESEGARGRRAWRR